MSTKKAWEDKITANSGTYEVNDQSLITGDFIGFELSQGAQLETFTVMKDGATVAENWITTTTRMFRNPTSAKLGGLYMLPDGYTGKTIKLSSGDIKLLLK